MLKSGSYCQRDDSPIKQATSSHALRQTLKVCLSIFLCVQLLKLLCFFVLRGYWPRLVRNLRQGMTTLLISSQILNQCVQVLLPYWL